MQLLSNLHVAIDIAYEILFIKPIQNKYQKALIPFTDIHRIRTCSEIHMISMSSETKTVSIVKARRIDTASNCISLPH